MTTYREYLQTDLWKDRAEEARKRADWRCQLCNTSGYSYQVPLDVHHRTYVRVGNEWDEDLIVLCRRCHTLFHKNVALGKDRPPDQVPMPLWDTPYEEYEATHDTSQPTTIAIGLLWEGEFQPEKIKIPGICLGGKIIAEVMIPKRQDAPEEAEDETT